MQSCTLMRPRRDSMQPLTHPGKQDNGTFTIETNTLASHRKARLSRVLQVKLAQKLTDQVTRRQAKPDRTSTYTVLH